MTMLFVSYAHDNKDVVQPLATELQGLGFDVWIDTRLKGGTLWSPEIVRAITNCDFFVLFVSSNSAKSDSVRREVDLAYKKGSKIIPVRIEKVNIPPEWDYQLAGIQWIEYEEPDWKSRLLVAIGKSSVQPAKAEEKGIGAISINNNEYLPSTEPAIIAKIEHMSDNGRLLEQQKDALTEIFRKATIPDMEEEKMTPQEMDPVEVDELYQKTSYAVAYYLSSLTEQQPALYNPLPGDPKTENAITMLTNIQQQVLLVATVAKVHSPGKYEIYQFESEMILASIKKLSTLLGDLDRYGNGQEDIPSNVQMQLDEEFDNLVFETGRILLLMQELAQLKRKSYVQ
jgi:hypothetical protein